MRKIIIVIPLLLAACAAPRAVNVEAIQTAEALAESSCPPLPFRQIELCVRQQFDAAYPAWEADPNADLIDTFLSWTHAESGRVRDGLVDENSAKRAGILLYQRLEQIAYQRRQRQEINQQTAASLMLAGIALLNAAQPAPPAIVTCQTTGNYYRITTICQ